MIPKNPAIGHFIDLIREELPQEKTRSVWIQVRQSFRLNGWKIMNMTLLNRCAGAWEKNMLPTGIFSSASTTSECSMVA
jgi:hypothetical protein